MIGSRQLVCPAAAPPIRQVQQQAHDSEQRCASGATQAFLAGLWEPMGAPEPAASSAQPRHDRPVDAQVGNAARSGRGRGLASGKERRVRSARMCRALLREKRQERGKSVMSSSFRAGRAISHSTRRRPGQQATMAPPRIKTRLPLLLPNWMLSPLVFFQPEPNEPASISAQHARQKTTRITPSSHGPHALPLLSSLLSYTAPALHRHHLDPACALFLFSLHCLLSLCCQPRTQEGLAVSRTQTHAPRITCCLGRTHSCKPDFSSARGFLLFSATRISLETRGSPRCRLDHTPQDRAACS